MLIRAGIEFGLDKFGQGVGKFLATGTYLHKDRYNNPTIEGRNDALISSSGFFDGENYHEFDHLKGILYINGKIIQRDKVQNSTMAVHNNYLNEFDYIEVLPNGRKHIIRELKGDDGSSDNTIIYTVPENNFFLMGDNRDNSIDSRVLNYVGFVPFENIIGKAEIIFFSIDRNKYGLNEFWKWRVRFDRIGKLINKKVNIFYESS